MTRRALKVGRALSQSLKPNWGIEGPYQWGTISAVVSGGGSSLSTVSVYLDNSAGGTGAAVTALIPFMNGYSPTVGDTVLLARMAGAARTQRIVLGCLATAANGLTQAGGSVTLGPAGGGPPISGTWATGTTLTDPTTFGRMVCTAGGSPGTWISVDGALTSPKAPTLVVTGGAAGSYTYEVVAVNSVGDAIPSATVSTTVGPTTLDGTHYIDINWTAPTGCLPTGYKVIRTVGGAAVGQIGGLLSSSTFTLRDNGLTASAYTAATKNPGGGYVVGGHVFRARAILTSAQTIPVNTFTKVNLDSVAVANHGYDPHGDFDTTNHWYVAPVSGWYDVSGFVENSGGSTTNQHVTYFVNGNERQRLFRQGTTGAPPTPGSGGTDSTYLNAGDQVSLVTYNASDNATLDTSVTTSPYLAVRYVGS